MKRVIEDVHIFGNSQVTFYYYINENLPIGETKILYAVHILDGSTGIIQRISVQPSKIKEIEVSDD